VEKYTLFMVRGTGGRTVQNLFGGSSNLGNQGVRLGDLADDPFQRFTDCPAAS
jgi:hypothetical protein